MPAAGFLKGAGEGEETALVRAGEETAGEDEKAGEDE